MDRKNSYPIQFITKHLSLRTSWWLMLLMLFPLLTTAQNVPFKKEFYFGAKGGMAFSRVKFKPNVEQNFYNGNSAGFLFRMISEPHVGIQVEFNYLQKGWEEKPLTGTTQGYFHRLNYFELPIMTHANLGSKAFRFTFNLGPSVAFLLSDSQGMNPATPGIPLQPPIPYWGKPIDSRIDFLFTGGIGTEYHFNKFGALALDARVFYSLTNLYDYKNYGYDPSQTNGVQVTLAYLFRLDKAKK
ncbi:MAG: PorT family protein [Bacteroidetes bacterium]|nr:PorT family protein [Bacteroidota bacterium]